MSLKNELSVLLNNGVISEETASRIKEFYSTKKSNSNQRLFIIYGILGALLVGLGIILILAHNWDQLSRTTKSIFAFIPLTIGQVLCIYALWKKSDSAAWRESSATFLAVSIGASIALMGQIYHLPEDPESFLLTWTLLGLPLVYLMRSSMSSLLYIMGITAYAVQSGYPHSDEPYWIYFLLLLAIIPHYLQLLRQKFESSFSTYHHWFIGLSIIICLGILPTRHDEQLFVLYMSLLALFIQLGKLPAFTNSKTRNNAYLLLGALGALIILFILSFDSLWVSWRLTLTPLSSRLSATEMLVSYPIIASAVAIYFLRKRRQSAVGINLLEFTSILFPIIFFIGVSSSSGAVLVNLLVLGIGILTLRSGSQKEHLGLMNAGLLIIAILIICRFSDTNMSFVVRGVLFVLLGTGFFLANYRLLKKRKSEE